MLNEVRRKPEKPRIFKSGFDYYCAMQKTGKIERCGRGGTPRSAYEDWKAQHPTPPNRA